MKFIFSLQQMEDVLYSQTDELLFVLLKTPNVLVFDARYNPCLTKELWTPTLPCHRIKCFTLVCHHSGIDTLSFLPNHTHRLIQHIQPVSLSCCCTIRRKYFEFGWCSYIQQQIIDRFMSINFSTLFFKGLNLTAIITLKKN